MKYYNLVYCKHKPENDRCYLYQLPLDADVNPGDKLCIRDRHGEQIVTAQYDNFFAYGGHAQMLCEANGGYFPPAKVIGTVDTVRLTQEVVNKFDGTQDTTWPPVEVKEESIWF